MKKTVFQLKKWWARAFVTIGAALGLSACFHTKTTPNEPIECVYGPPPGYDDIEVIEDVYGPPIEEIDTVADSIVVEPKANKDNSRR